MAPLRPHIDSVPWSGPYSFGMQAVNDLTIGRLARAAGVGVETIRFYERKRLLARPRRPERGFRVYPGDAVRRIRFIRQAQELGFTLREIAELLSLQADPAVDCSKVFARATAKLEDVGRKIAQLSRMKQALERVAAACPRHGTVTACSILEAMERPSGGAWPAPPTKPPSPPKRGHMHMKTITLNIEGMHCDGCAETIKGLLDSDPGVKQSAVAYKDRSARILFDPHATSGDRLAAAIRRAGFRVSEAE